MTLAQLLPEYDVNEVHACWVAAPRARVYEAVKAATAGEMPVVRALFAVRSLPATLRGKSGLPRARDESLYEQIVRFGFTVLADDPGRELVVGIVSQPWKLDGGRIARMRDAAEFNAFKEPGFVKAAMSFEVDEQAGRTRLRTETRVQATDAIARRGFARYWRVIRPGSGAIRRSWLRAAKRRAETPAAHR